MANKFVWSGATGAASGANWADAYTSLARDWGAEAGFDPATDFVYVRSVHAETEGSVDWTITGSTAESTTARVRVICCVGDTTGTDPGALATGASVTTTATLIETEFQAGLYIYGVNFYSNSNFEFGSTAEDSDLSFEACRFEITNTGTGKYFDLGGNNIGMGHRQVFANCTFDIGNAAQYLLVRTGEVDLVGCTFEANFTQLIANNSGGKTEIRFIGCDLSNQTGILVNYAGGLGGTAVSSLISFERCVMGSGFTLLNGALDVPGLRVRTVHCQVGTDADPAYQLEAHTARGSTSTDTSRYRTGGASDGERSTPISWAISTNDDSVRSYPGHALESPPIAAWTDGDGATAHTYRIAFASDATITDAELWMELAGPNDAATNSKAVFYSSRVAPLTTPSNLTTDSGSTWTGTGVTTKQYMQVTYTPDKPGPIVVRIFMAKASDVIYVDPYIQIDP